jgi:(S)-2-hydroxyglutarate dehydrogenase
VAVVGGGIVGLAVARELCKRRPLASVCVFEREPTIGAHQTGHNSGVIHTGVYYAPGSLKARLCVEGARELYSYCEARAIPHARCGKVIVASEPRELDRLDELERRARANGVPGVRRLDARAIETIEPHARGVAGLHSPHTGIVDFAAVARAYAEDVRAADGAVVTGCEITDLRVRGNRLRLEHGLGTSAAGYAIVCAGAWSDRLAVRAGASPDPRIVPFRGAYLKLAPARAGLVRGLIYPVPDPDLPFLGVHLIRTIAGEVLIGPTALLAPARGAHEPAGARMRDLLQTAAWPGTWRMAARNWRAGLTELRYATSRAALVRAARRYVPELSGQDAGEVASGHGTAGVVERAFAGVRAQALGRDGTLLDDFAFSATARALHVRNAPSPGATSALAIAGHVVDEAERAFGST